ncbi:hypothetical protein DL764_008746 [Monosporascus ibericus]|uniref:FAD-binding PCMH-type domain-containing protein n=1 Tax=Monosporascus ibericus TaxID=155417 RepID=A0A4Q4SWP6_9PEZI|nr:hypothetical protein DL764_008746 [Monosporascus ibericus]
MVVAVSAATCPQAVNLVNAGLAPRTLYPTDPAYLAREESYWARNVRLGPACIVIPQSAEEVSIAHKSLAAAKQQFAVRSGGHSPSTGANNVAGGVTIDLSRLDKTVFDAETETAHIGAGGRWKDVYGELHKYGRVVPGGRTSDVGVSGVLLGGGSSWMTARNGWACDNVRAFEVVLADGRIITADKDNYQDLFQALKGGSNNFGIVTRFTMGTIPSDRVWGGVTATPKDAIPEVVDVMWNFTEGASVHRDSYLMTVLGYFPDFKDNVASTAVLQAGGFPNAPEYDGWRKLPKFLDTTKVTSIYELSTEITLPTNYYNSWFTLCFKNDRSIMNKAAQVHEELVEELKSYIPDGDFIPNCIFQPVPNIVAEHSAAAGGNIMGLERHLDNAILFQYSAMMKTADQAAFVYPKLKAGVQAVKDFAASVDGGLMELLYMNYADKSQDVLRSYGSENLEKMRKVAAKYDSDQVFQRLCRGGWKISDVN